jgi:hypothetical protein
MSPTGGMYTASQYGNSAQYITGNYRLPGSNQQRGVWGWLAGLVAVYDGAGGAPSNLIHVRQVAYYSGANLDVTTRQLTAGTIFVGIKGHQRVAFAQNNDWTITKQPT